jgi:spore cortex formation protein SpoVR/YcgB (stage V sporulation)
MDEVMTELEKRGIITPDAYISFLHSHSSVIYQPDYHSKHYSGMNPYALGFAIFSDIKRICTAPTDEDRQYMPHLIGKKWQDAVKEAAYEYRDDSFIAQFLSPKVIRDLGLFSVHYEVDEQSGATAFVSDIHDEDGYIAVRTRLAQSYERINKVPQIVVVGADFDGDRTLKLKYIPFKGRGLNVEYAEQTLEHVDALWQYPVELDY